MIYILTFASFSNLTFYTAQNYGLVLLPVLFALSAAALLMEILTSRSYYLTNYQQPGTYVINFFLLLFLTVGLVNANINTNTFNDIIYPLLTNFLIFHLVLLTVNKPEEVDGVLMSAVLAGPLLALQGGYQFFREMSQAAFDFNLRAYSWWVDPNYYSLVLNLVYLVSFYFLEKRQLRWRIMGIMAQASVVLGIFLSLSRGGIATLALITLLNWRVLLRNRTYLAALLLIVVLLCLIFYFNIFNIGLLENINFDRLLVSSTDYQGDYSNNRTTGVMSGLLIFAQHPLLGCGFGNILDYAESLTHFRMNTHNMFIEILAVSGVLPFLGYLFMLGYLLIEQVKRARTAAGRLLLRYVIVLAWMGFFAHYLMYLKPVWVLLALLPVCCQLNGGRHNASADNNR